MRKRTILDENYMALEQSIAQALDEAEQIIIDAKLEYHRLFESFYSEYNAEEGVFLESPQYINYKNSEELDEIFEGYQIQKNIADSVKILKEKREFTLVECALLSESVIIEAENEVEKMTSFFGGKDNIEIPDSESNIFNVVVNEEGIRKGYTNFRLMLEGVQSLQDAYNEAIRNNDTDSMNENLQKLAATNRISKVLIENGEKELIEALKMIEKESSLLEKVDFNTIPDEKVSLRKTTLGTLCWLAATKHRSFMDTVKSAALGGGITRNIGTATSVIMPLAKKTPEAMAVWAEVKKLYADLEVTGKKYPSGIKISRLQNKFVKIMGPVIKNARKQAKLNKNKES